MNKKKLELLLQQVREPLLPKLLLEQYTVPTNLAAEILNLAYLAGDVKGNIVFDLGCGSGRLAIGASLLGAKIVVGVDKDKELIKLAKYNVKYLSSILRKKLRVALVCGDIKNFFGKCDTVIQNPPFGVKTRHADRLFLEKALECGKKIYSLHRGGYKKTREFLTRVINSYNGDIEKIISFKFSLPRIFKFHKKPRVTYEVDLYIIKIK
ncbi:MAG: METTL5 family protein [Candidatus Aenigmarchaeota archaeon]|nr:METTL5 family protein [Candidatus Aenigmarchaeota archaeon]